MRAFANLGVITAPVLTASREIVADIEARNTTGQAYAVRDFLSARLRFLSDPVDIEVLETPESMLKTIATRGYAMGDCDNAAVLSAALLKSIGIRCRFVILGFTKPNAPYQHVYTEAFTPAGWVDMDTTAPAGGTPPTITRRYVMEV